MARRLPDIREFPARLFCRSAPSTHTETQSDRLCFRLSTIAFRSGPQSLAYNRSWTASKGLLNLSLIAYCRCSVTCHIKRRKRQENAFGNRPSVTVEFDGLPLSKIGRYRLPGSTSTGTVGHEEQSQSSGHSEIPAGRYSAGRRFRDRRV